MIRRAGGLILCDEVQPGFGRVGSHWWGHDWLGFAPDVVTMGKPMGNGYPVAAVVARADVMAAFRGAFGYFNTFGGNPVACAAATAVLDVIEDEGLVAHAQDVGGYMLDLLRALSHPLIASVRGVGLFFAVELARDGAPASAEAARVVEAMREAGVLMGRGGRAQHILKLRPPMPFTRENADMAVAALAVRAGRGSGLSLTAAQAALALWGSDRPPRLVTERENKVYEAWLPDGRHVALRLHRPGYQTREAIDAELDWTAKLARAGFPAPAPVATLDGALCAEAGGWIASCVTWIDGAPIGAAGVPLAGGLAEQIALHHDLGRLIADLHSTTDALNLPTTLPRASWDEDGLCGPDPLWGRFWDNPGLDAPGRETLIAARDTARTRLAAFRAGGADYGLIHADVLRENVLRGPDGLVLIDFDDAGYGFRMYDLGTALLHSLDEPHLPHLARALLDGYRQTRPLSPQAAALLPLFVTLRCLASAGWIIARAAPDDPRHAHYAARALRMARHILSGTAPWDGAQGFSSENPC